MKELIEEFRLLGLDDHQYHRTAEWKDCEYAFCQRRYQIWANAAVIGMRTCAAVEVSDPPVSVDRAYKLGHEHGMATARELLTMETSAAPGVMLPRAGKLLSDLFPDGIEVEMRGDQLTYVGGKPAVDLKEEES